jgi:Flp pilus assembly pilin Flp
METQYSGLVRAMLVLAKSKRGQSSIEYLMMLSAVSIVIIIALAMITQLKGAAVHSFFNGTNGSVISTIKTEISNITSQR